MVRDLFFKISSYLKFIYNSKNRHGIHSPFIYDLVTKCFNDCTYRSEYDVLKFYRKSLDHNKNFINVKDFGAGSKVFKTNRRQISRIAKTAGISQKNAQLLFRIVQYFQPETILEIGSSLGLATSALALGNKSAKITTLEGCAETANQCQIQLEEFKLENVNLILIEFAGYFHTLDNLQPAIDFIYFDGNHSCDATLNYFERLLPTITNKSVWIFDDIHWSADMEKAWHHIKMHPTVTVTIDTFQWGIVFFRTEQAKENFVIRM